MSSQPVALGCVPSSISPSSWIPGFSDSYKGPKDFMCAIAGPDPDVVTKLGDQCCKGEVKSDDSGCYHWCVPSYAENTVDWATCISDHVYTDNNFGYACNPPGELQLKNEKNAHDKAVAEADPDDDTGDKKRKVKRETSAAAPGSNVSWKTVGAFVGFVGLVQAMC